MSGIIFTYMYMYMYMHVYVLPYFSLRPTEHLNTPPNATSSPKTTADREEELVHV